MILHTQFFNTKTYDHEIAKHAKWTSADVQSRTNHLTILFIKVELEEEHTINIIKVKMWKTQTQQN